jgi:hypothetical protein
LLLFGKFALQGIPRIALGACTLRRKVRETADILLIQSQVVKKRLSYRLLQGGGKHR